VARLPIAWQANGTFDEKEQTYVDTYSKVAHAKLYSTKTPPLGIILRITLPGSG